MAPRHKHRLSPLSQALVPRPRRCGRANVTVEDYVVGLASVALVGGLFDRGPAPRGRAPCALPYWPITVPMHPLVDANLLSCYSLALTVAASAT
jgi:hypothetical protein